MPDPRNTDRGAANRRPVHPVVAVGFVLFLTGCVAALWLGDWRYAATGVAPFLAAAVATAAGRWR
jgi:hypothetical protein